MKIETLNSGKVILTFIGRKVNNLFPLEIRGANGVSLFFIDEAGNIGFYVRSADNKVTRRYQINADGYLIPTGTQGADYSSSQ